MPKNIFSFFSKQKISAAVLKNVTPEMLAFLEKLPTAILLVGASGKIGLANPAALVLLGQEKDSLIGANVQQLGISPAQLKELSAVEIGKKKLIKITDLKGTSLLVKAGAQKLGETSFTTLTLEPMNELEQSANQNSFLEEVLNHYPGAVTVQDMTGKCLFWSEQASQFFATSAKQARGKIIYQLLPTQLSSKLYSLDEEIKAVGKLEEPSRWSYPLPDGSEQKLVVTKTLIQSKGKPAFIVTFYEPPANRYAREEKLEQDQKMLQAILENIPLGIYTRDCDEEVTYANAQSMRIFNETEAYHADHPHAYQANAKLQEYKQRERQILKEGKTYEYPEEVYTDSSGNQKIIHIIKVPLPDAGPKPVVLTIAEDITKRHEREREIRRINSFLTAIVQNAPIALYARTEDGQMVLRNKQCDIVFGVPDSTKVDQRGGLVHETDDQIAGYLKREHDILETGQTMDIPEEEYITPKGEKRLLHMVKTPVPEGRCVVTLVEDITSKKAQERALVEAKNFLQTVINQLPVSLSIKNYDGKYILWNKKSEELFGVAAKDVVGKDAYRSDLNKEQAEFVRETDMRVFESKKEQNIPQELISSASDGIKIMHTVKTPVFNDDGTPNCLLIVSEDITAKTKMEKQIREAGDKNNLLLENAREGVVMMEDGKIIHANRALCKMLGVESLEDLQGKALLDFSTENHRVFLKEKYEAVRSGADDGSTAVETHFVRRDGTKIEAQFSAVLAKYLGRRIVLGFVRDVTAENRSLRALRKDRDNLRRAFEHSALAALVLSPKGYISFMNEACRNLFGFTEQDQKFYCNVYLRPGITLPVRRAMRKGERAEMEYVFDFDQMARKFPERIEKTGKMPLRLSFVPLTKRDAKDGSVEAEYLVCVQPAEALADKPQSYFPAATDTADLQFSKTAKAAASLPPPPPFLGAEQMGEVQGTARLMLPDSEPYALCNEHFVITDCNDLLSSLCELQKDELVGQDIRRLFDQDEKPLVEQDFQLLEKEGKLSPREYTIQLGSGLETCKVRLTAIKQEPSGYLFVLHSLAFHLQIMKILEERSAQLAALRSATQGAVVRVFGQKGKLDKLEQLNNWLSTKTGYSHEELSQRVFSQLFTQPKKEGDSVELTIAKAQKQLFEKGSAAFVLPLQRKGTTPLPVQVSLASLDIPRTSEFIAVFNELPTSKSLAQKATTEAQELAGLLEVLPGLYLRVDEHGNVLAASSHLPDLDNEQAQKQLVGQNLEACWPKQAATQVLFSIKESLAVHASSHVEFEWTAQTKTHFYEADIYPLADEAQAIVWVRDTSEKRMCDEHLYGLYRISQQTGLSITEQVEKMLNLGKQIFQADAGLVLRFHTRNKRLENTVLYVSENTLNLERGMEFAVEECLRDVVSGAVVLLPDLDGLSCEKCLHQARKLGALLAAPLWVEGKVEGALCFAFRSPKHAFGAGSEELLGLMSRLLGLCIELRQTGKMLDVASRMFTQTLEDLQVPALRVDADYVITHANQALLRWTGRKIGSLLGRDMFTELAAKESSVRHHVQHVLEQASGTSFCQVKWAVSAPGQNGETAWDVVVCKDEQGLVNGYILLAHPKRA